MISKLEAEAAADVTEKAYCDSELAKTSSKKGELDNEISKLTSKIDAATSKSANLKAFVKDAEAELAQLAGEQASMDSIRSEERANYNKAKTDLELGIAGVQKALGLLKNYYGSAAFVQNDAEIGALMQQQPPSVHEKASVAGGKIVDLLENIESDFAKSLAAVEAEGADATADYKRLTLENDASKTMKSEDVTYNTKEFKSLDKSIADLSGDRDTSFTELSAVNEYFGKLKERCIGKPETYSERRARRESEISGLKEALQILENETAFTQRGKHLRSRHAVM